MHTKQPREGKRDARHVAISVGWAHVRALCLKRIRSVSKSLLHDGGRYDSIPSVLDIYNTCLRPRPWQKTDTMSIGFYIEVDDPVRRGREASKVNKHCYSKAKVLHRTVQGSTLSLTYLYRCTPGWSFWEGWIVLSYRDLRPIPKRKHGRWKGYFLVVILSLMIRPWLLIGYPVVFIHPCEDQLN
jgi:hypothetical protein